MFNNSYPSNAEWSQYLTSYIPYLILGLWAIAVNLLIIFAIGKDKWLRGKHQLLIALATGELLIGLAIFTSGVGRLLYIGEGTHKTSVSHLSCLIRPWNPFFMMGYQLTAIITIIISLERLACVAAPIRYYQLPCKLYIKYAIYAAVVVVVISMLGGFFTSYNISGNVANICMTSDTFTASYALYNYTVCAVSGVLTAVVYLVSTVVMRMNLSRLKSNSQARSRLTTQAKLTKMMAIVMSSQFVLVALPNLGKMTAIIAKINSAALTAFWPYLSHAAVSNACLTAVFYALFNAELLDAFRVAIGMKPKSLQSHTGTGLTQTIAPSNIMRVLPKLDVVTHM